MRIADLSPVVEGNYGWCVDLCNVGNGHPRLVYYDDDDDWCVRADCNFDQSCPALRAAVQGDDQAQIDGHSIDSGALVYTLEGSTQSTETVPYTSLLRLPAKITERRDTSTKEGWVYAVAIVPEFDLRRLKIGFTSTPIVNRLKAYRTANPTLLLVGLWEADRADESHAHAVVDGQIGTSEVFECRDLTQTLRHICGALGDPDSDASEIHNERARRVWRTLGIR